MLETTPRRPYRVTATGTQHSRVSKPSPAPRRSARIQRIREALVKEKSSNRHQLPSPSSSPSPKPITNKKRKQLEDRDSLAEQQPPKRLRVLPGSTPPEAEYNPLRHWAETGRWPDNFSRLEHKMGRDGSSKRKSPSTHHSDRLQRLDQNGVHMTSSALLQRESKKLCHELLEGSRVPTQYPCYPADSVPDVLERVHERNEFRLARDLTPLIMPSPENLFFSGDLSADYLSEEVQAEWTRCATIGGTRPKPDFAVGLKRSAFTLAEVDKLQNYANSQQPFLFTPCLCFPFLICEVKTGQQGLEIADRQNIHSASVAVRAIIKLAQAAFGREDERATSLLGKVLVFTISHNNRTVNLYGHYAVASQTADSRLEFYRYDIDTFSLTMREGRERFNAYNFVCNVYEKFAPTHLARLQAAISCLPALPLRTGLSFVASELGLDDAGSQTDSQQASQDESYLTPKEPASTVKIREQLEQKMEQQQTESNKQIERLLERLERQEQEQQRQQQEQQRQQQVQLDQQRNESKEQLAQERKASKEREGRLQQQIEQQRREAAKEAAERRQEAKEAKEQMDKMMQLMSHLQSGRAPTRGSG